MHILLTVLLAILWTIIVVLGLVLLIAAAALFVPLRYRCKISKAEEISAFAKVTWLLHIFKFTFSYESGAKTEFTIFGKHVDMSASEEKALEQKKPAPEKKTSAIKSKSVPQKARASAQKPNAKSNPKAKAQPSEPGVKERLKAIWNYPGKKEIWRLVKKLLLRLLRALKPKQVRIRGELGLGDPAETGKLFAWLSAIRIVPLDIRLRPNFLESVQNIDFHLKGRLALWSLLWPLLAFALSKPIWKIIKSYIFKNKKDDENGKLG